MIFLRLLTYHKCKIPNLFKVNNTVPPKIKIPKITFQIGVPFFLNGSFKFIFEFNGKVAV